jgi:hypothetical protein
VQGTARCPLAGRIELSRAHLGIEFESPTALAVAFVLVPLKGSLVAYALHHRFSFGGHLNLDSAQGEIWECTVNAVGRDGTADESFAFDSYLAQVKDNMGTWFSSHGGIAIGATLDYIKLNLIGADGRYVDRTSSHRLDYTPAPQGGDIPINPDIISTATSWFTALARGPGAHGRVYLPNFTYGGNNDMHIPTADQTKAATAGIGLLTVMNNSGGGGLTWWGVTPPDHHVLIPVVASRVNATNTDILGVKVGSVKDVQRRRKSALKETYVRQVFLAETS